MIPVACKGDQMIDQIPRLECEKKKFSKLNFPACLTLLNNAKSGMIPFI